MPSDGSVSVREFQLFMKRLRKRYGEGIRFFHCGEYGSKLSRPHYHACLFNFDFDDKYLWSTRDGVRLYRSPSLDEIWGLGFATVGDVTFESASYVARYITKKVNGEQAQDHYDGKSPEYITMSRRPGIGRGWYDKFKNDVYPDDFVVVRGVKMPPPKFYDGLFEHESPDVFQRLKVARVKRAKKLVSHKTSFGETILVDDNDRMRLRVKETVKKARINTLKRTLEDQ